MSDGKGRRSGEGTLPDPITEQDVFCCRRSNDVSRDEIHKFVGALHGQKASKGIFITTSSFRKNAVEYAASLEGKKVILIDGEMLTRLMFETGLGLTTTNRYEVKKLDSDYFEEEGAPAAATEN